MKKINIAFVLLMFYFNSFAGVELVGTTSSNFIKIPPFARAVGMGEAFAAISDGTYGLYYNPAGLSSVLGFEVQLTHISWFQGINYEFFSIVTPMPFIEIGKLGLAFAWFQIDEMDKTSELPSYDHSDLATTDFDLYKIYKFSPYNYSVILGYGLEIQENLTGGISIKYTAENIDKSTGANITADTGFIYKLELKDHLLRLGLNLSNLGPELKMDKIGFEPPKILKIGISDQFNLFSNKLLLASQIIMQVDYDNLYSFGLEYWIQNLVALRAGYKLGAFNHPTFGAGIRYNNIEFDYAFVKYDELGDTHRFSALYSWGTPPVKLKVNPPVFSPNNDLFLDNTSFIPVIKSKEKINSMKINIFDAEGKNILAKLTVASGSAREIKWDGVSDGLVLPDNVYLASLETSYETGISESNKISVEIDNTPPEMRIDAEPKLLKPGQKEALLIPATFTLYAADRNKVAKWQFVIWDSNKKVFYSTGGNGEPPLSLIWDGKGNTGEYVETGQIYYYSLATTDSVGNKAQTKPQSQVVLLKEIKLTYSSDALFDLGLADVKISAYSILKEMKKTINKYPDSEILVAGHTDNLQPVGIRYKNNLELSKARADAVKFFMVNLLNISEKRIKTEGFADTKPIATNDNEEGRSKNRRVEIIIKSTIYK